MPGIPSSVKSFSRPSARGVGMLSHFIDEGDYSERSLRQIGNGGVLFARTARFDTD